MSTYSQYSWFSRCCASASQKGTFSPLSSYRVGRRGGKIPSPPPPFCRGQNSGSECHACSPKRQIAKTQVRQSKRGGEKGGQLFLLGWGEVLAGHRKEGKGNIGSGNPFAAKPSDNRKENLASLFLRAGKRESR